MAPASVMYRNMEKNVVLLEFDDFVNRSMIFDFLNVISHPLCSVTPADIKKSKFFKVD